MYCPECGLEYDEDLTECRECDVPLVGGSPQALPVVFETNERISLAMARGLLESAGIPYLVGGQIATLVQDVDGHLRKWIRLQVPAEYEAEAREILEQLERPISILPE